MKNREPGRFPTGANLGECAVILCAGPDNGFSGTALLARTITDTPPNERIIRGVS